MVQKMPCIWNKGDGLWELSRRMPCWLMGLIALSPYRHTATPLDRSLLQLDRLHNLPPATSLFYTNRAKPIAATFARRVSLTCGRSLLKYTFWDSRELWTRETRVPHRETMASGGTGDLVSRRTRQDK